MREVDKDLRSIQEVRNLLRKASQAQSVLADFSQERVDEIVRNVSERAYEHREMLAKMAVEETGFGRYEDKILKNVFASKTVHEAIKEWQTVGVLAEDSVKKTLDIAVPVGVIAGLIPSTNPTSTVIYKALLALKTRNTIVFSPHPGAIRAILKAVEIVEEAAVSAGAPEGCVSVMSLPTLVATQELMKNDLTKLILATGGNAMVKAAYSSGTPAIGVGPGNGPAYIHPSAHVELAVKRIIDSKTFDNGTVCASEQSVICEASNRVLVQKEFEAQGGYFLPKEESEKLAKFLLRPNGTMNPAIVGKSVAQIAEISGIQVPCDARVLLAEETNVGHNFPYSREKLAPILAFYTVENWQEALSLATDILLNEGAGHTMMIHAEQQEIIEKFAQKIPVSRLLVNTMGALGGIGGSTELFPSLTLGCGAIGGSATSDNVSPMNLLNIRRVAYGVREMEDLRPSSSNAHTEKSVSYTDELVERLAELVLSRLQ